MVASVNSIQLGQKNVIKSKGLADHHAYTVLTALSVIGDNGE